ncbi:MAG: hypothetical protein CTY34_10405 [Methylobacter sp.]|nr:MAG: hypothetical protein CTY34_10405 [Methylobacter sp.]PPD03960.1 MAG: hypothetical protein CTY29_07500 [Methylobacter sp.]PPD36522.1 MAG: hypothetical protein CTY18_03870 [Methylomonas sp.]
MFYAIIAEDIPNSLEHRLAVRPIHLERLQALQDEGRLLLAGPHPTIDCEDPGAAGFSGGLIVAEFPSLAAAHAWVEADPYVTTGVYARYEIKPFKKVFPQ